MLAEIQVSPRPYGDESGEYALVHPALELIQASGLTHEVHALGTVVEGSPDEVWALLRAVHEAALTAGATTTASIIKVHQGADAPADAEGSTGDGDTRETTPTIARLTKHWR